MKILHSVMVILAVACLAATGCGGGEGTLADYFGWQSLGGTWRGTLQLSDGRELPIAMTFTEFDGEGFYVVVEAGEGVEYIRNEADADYSMDTKSFTFQLLPFFGGPCSFDGRIVGTYDMTGNILVDLGLITLTGLYDITYTP